MVRTVLLLVALAAAVSARSSGSVDEDSGWTMTNLGSGLKDVAESIADALDCHFDQHCTGGLHHRLYWLWRDRRDYFPRAMVAVMDAMEEFSFYRLKRWVKRAPGVMLYGVRDSAEVLGAMKEDWVTLMGEALQLQEENTALASRLQELEDERCACLPDSWYYSGVSLTAVQGFLLNCPPGSASPTTGQDFGEVSCEAGVCPKTVPEETCSQAELEETMDSTSALLLGRRGWVVKENPLNASLLVLTPSSPTVPWSYLSVPWTWIPWMRQHVLKLQEEREAFTSQLQQQGPEERCACVPETWHSGISVTGVTGFHVTCPTGSVNPTTGQAVGEVPCPAGVCPQTVPLEICKKLDTSSVLLVGGYNHRGSSGSDGYSSSVLFPTSPGCTPPSMPPTAGGLDPFTFTHAGSLVTCGGYVDSAQQKTCLVLKANGWEPDYGRFPDFPNANGRSGGTVVSVAEGTIVIGGESWGGSKSLVLRHGASSWEEGPVRERSDCSVAWGGAVFGISENRLWKLNTTTWQMDEEAKLPQLPPLAPVPQGQWMIKDPDSKPRSQQGCAVINNHLVVAGGNQQTHACKESGYPCGYVTYVLDSTFSLDLSQGSAATWMEGGSLGEARNTHSMVTVMAGGKEKLYALGGWNKDYDYNYLDSVEVWREETRTWEQVEERLPEGRQRMGVVAVNKAAVCPP